MKRKRIRLPSPAMVVAIIALLVGLGSGAYAAKIKLGKNAVKTKSIKNGAVTEPKLAKGAVSTDKLVNGAVTSEKIAGPALGQAVAYAAISNTGDVNESKSRGITDAMVSKPGGNGGIGFCLHGLPDSGTALVSGLYDGSFEFEGWPTIAVEKAPLHDVDCDTVAGTQYEVITAQGDVDNNPDGNDAAAFVIALFK
jgi:hypothetical protein